MDKKICNNPICRADNPIEAKFCRKCGSQLSNSVRTIVNSVSVQEDDMRPFYLRHPELHLKPISEFEELSFFFKSPEYVEDPTMAEDSEYLYIARKGKLGILHWVIERETHFFTKDTFNHIYNRIIPCEYDRIDKANGHFVCYKGSQVTYIDLKGNILK